MSTYYCDTIPITCSRVLNSSPGRLGGLEFRSPPTVPVADRRGDGGAQVPDRDRRGSGGAQAAAQGVVPPRRGTGGQGAVHDVPSCGAVCNDQTLLRRRQQLHAVRDQDDPRPRQRPHSGMGLRNVFVSAEPDRLLVEPYSVTVYPRTHSPPGPALTPGLEIVPFTQLASVFKNYLKRGQTLDKPLKFS